MGAYVAQEGPEVCADLSTRREPDGGSALVCDAGKDQSCAGGVAGCPSLHRFGTKHRFHRHLGATLNSSRLEKHILQESLGVSSTERFPQPPRADPSQRDALRPEAAPSLVVRFCKNCAFVCGRCRRGHRNCRHPLCLANSFPSVSSPFASLSPQLGLKSESSPSLLAPAPSPPEDPPSRWRGGGGGAQRSRCSGTLNPPLWRTQP